MTQVHTLIFQCVINVHDFLGVQCTEETHELLTAAKQEFAWDNAGTDFP